MTRAGLSLAGLTVLLAVGACRVTLRFDGPDAGSGDAGPSVGSACSDDQDCPLPSLHCDPSSGACFPCVSDPDCSTVSGHPRCDTALHICVQCGVVGDCPPGWRCLGAACVQSCLSMADCSTAGAVCDDDLCGQCDEDRECSSAATPYCAANHQCAACTSNGQCTAAAPRCNVTTGRCVACLTSNDCSVGEVCDPSDWICKVPSP